MPLHDLPQRFFQQFGDGAAGPVAGFVAHRAGAQSGQVDDGRIRARVTAPTAWMVAQQLAGWGDSIEVLGPDEVRAEL
ncbi:WYL domain-containing protein, partial [Nocardia cyriacigeorgica]|uniref:WYL domain-containing protein n=1 Tax=Nocardia cyriacigeorgica TaxID=135487 RepID=UPI00313BF4B0